MTKLESAINDRIRQLQDYIIQKETALRTAPRGRLRICQSASRIQYYHMTRKGDTGGRYIQKKDQALVRKLAQKQYDRDVLDAAKKELTALSMASARLPSLSAEEVYEAISEQRRTLVMPLRTPDAQFITDWIRLPYEKKPISEDTPEHYTNRGERVRSKSEVIIANTLYYLNIPYKYECPLTLNDGTVLHPDFTILNVRDRKEYYLEHLGKMEDPEYCETALSRMALYQRNGLYLGERLILSCETIRHPLNTKELERILRHYF